jgi:hypothetical protein
MEDRLFGVENTRAFVSRTCIMIPGGLEGVQAVQLIVIGINHPRFLCLYRHVVR